MGRVSLIDLKEAGQGCRNLASITSARFEGAGDESRGPIADHPLHLQWRQRRAPALAKHFVHRRVQVRQTVDERSVKIEHEQKSIHGSALCVVVPLCAIGSKWRPVVHVLPFAEW